LKLDINDLFKLGSNWHQFVPYSPEELSDRIQAITCHRAWAISSIKMERLLPYRYIWEIEAIIDSQQAGKEAGYEGVILQFLIWVERLDKLYLPPGLQLPEDLGSSLREAIGYCLRTPEYRNGARLYAAIFDERLRKRVRTKTDEFIWERLYPGTLFAPLGVFLEHMNRYKFVADTIGDYIFGTNEVLDLGCGLGYGAKHLATRLPGLQIFAVDRDSETLADAAKYYSADNITWVWDDVVGLGGYYADVIVCLELLEHMHRRAYPTRDDLLNTIIRLLNPGGIAFISTPNSESERRRNIRNPYHTCELTYDEFSGLLNRHFGEFVIGSLLCNNPLAQERCCIGFVPPKEHLSQVAGFIAICRNPR
jgi:2-polyprenyl-3-methyl-5-hydroxy-6-metoxy-1,4-benzoquinol methylase